MMVLKYAMPTHGCLTKCLSAFATGVYNPTVCSSDGMRLLRFLTARLHMESISRKTLGVPVKPHSWGALIWKMSSRADMYAVLSAATAPTSKPLAMSFNTPLPMRPPRILLSVWVQDGASSCLVELNYA